MRPISLGAALLSAIVAFTGVARAESGEIRISKGYGIHYLPLYVMQHDQLLEQAARQAGLGNIKVSWPVIDGGNNINDAMLAGALDIAALGVPGFLTLWGKAKGNARLEVIGLAGVGAGSLYLNTRNPDIKTLKDFTAADKIALPGIKTSYAAFILQMVVAKEFGDENYAKLDPLTVGMPYPEATAALLSGKTEIDAHVASPRFPTWSSIIPASTGYSTPWRCSARRPSSWPTPLAPFMRRTRSCAPPSSRRWTRPRGELPRTSARRPGSTTRWRR